MKDLIWAASTIALLLVLYRAIKWRREIVMGDHLKTDGQFLRGYRDGQRKDDSGRKLLAYAMKEGYFNLYLFGAACSIADQQGKPHPKPWGKF